MAIVDDLQPTALRAVHCLTAVAALVPPCRYLHAQVTLSQLSDEANSLGQVRAELATVVQQATVTNTAEALRRLPSASRQLQPLYGKGACIASARVQCQQCGKPSNTVSPFKLSC